MSTTNRPAVTDVPVVKEKMSRRHVLVIVTGIMITFGCSALVFSTWGLFQPVVSDALGIPTTRFALYITILYLTMTACSPSRRSATVTVPPRGVNLRALETRLSTA